MLRESDNDFVSKQKWRIKTTQRAITRAKKKVTVVISIRGADISAEIRPVVRL
jgi:hypothetical protein